jgi:glyceraldehyde-3-phosphate dehydrogenase (NADP+)
MTDLSAKLKGMFPTADGIPESVRVDAKPYLKRWLVDGQIRPWDGPELEVDSPVCVKLPEGGYRPVRLGAFPKLGEAQAMEAVEAAAAAYGQGRGLWPTMSVAKRIEHVESFIPRMVAMREPVVRLIMWEICKSRADAENEFDRTVDYIKLTIDALKQNDRQSAQFAVNGGFIAQIRRSPLGVVLCMGPYNYPLNETYTTLIPALIMGNTVVFKPPRFGALLHMPLLEAFRDSFPAGVVNTVFGEGRTVVGPMMQSGKIDVLAFIGSSKVADGLKKQHPAPHRLRSVLGLDAKNAAMVLPDADIEVAAKECVLGSLSYNGQRCTAIKMTFVHRSRVNAFLERLSAEIASLPMGMPWDKGVKLTPLPEEDKTGAMSAFLQDAVSKGARVVNPGGGTVEATYFHPAVAYPVKPDMQLWSHEQFGPIVPVAAYDDEAEFIRYVVESKYGQQVALFGRDPAKLGRLVDALVNQVSRVNINSQCQRGPDSFPFTGRKSSAEGTLSVSDALRAFSIRSMVAAKSTPDNRTIFSGIVTGRHSEFLSTDFLF